MTDSCLIIKNPAFRGKTGYQMRGSPYQILNAALDAVIEDNIPNNREALLAHLNLN